MNVNYLDRSGIIDPATSLQYLAYLYLNLSSISQETRTGMFASFRTSGHDIRYAHTICSVSDITESYIAILIKLLIIFYP